MAQKKKEGEFTWEEIAKHNTYDSCWLYVDETVYDVTEWLPKHPGGDDMLLLFSGRDCSQSFRCYHPFSDKPFALLEKYKIGKLKGPSELVRWKSDSGFYKTASQRCADYFKQKKIDPLQNTWLYEFMRLGTSIVFFLYGFYLALKLMVDWGLPFYIRALLTIPLGASGFMIAINVGHMCSHMPFLHTPKVNYFLGWFSWDFCLGLSYDIWLHEHVVGHHQYTNIITIDPNCPESFGADSLYRGSWNQKWFKHYAYQVLWLPLVSFLLVKENRFACLRYWSKGLRKDVRVNAHYLGTSSKILFIIGKICFYFRMYFWPWYAWNAPWYEILFMVQVTEMVAGYVVGTIFPANHITSEAVWPLIRTDEKGQRWIDAEWAVMQMEATKDYSFDNKLLSFMFGNLNNHTAHHMFPGMHHGHYQDIAPIIRQAAREYKIKIHSTETFAEFLYLYFRHLWNLGYETQKDL